jgi:ATP-dependent DNA helicase UvrD/PcrA
MPFIMPGFSAAVEGKDYILNVPFRKGHVITPRIAVPSIPERQIGLFMTSGETPPYLQAMNDAQRAAVEALEGPVLVLAGAGTGKTRVLTTRIAHLLATGKAALANILAVTFTNKAAFEMQGRVASLLNRPVAGLAIGTFHSISARFLRAHAELAGLKSDFTILDEDDQVRLLKQLLSVENIDDKRWPARVLAGWIERWKNRALTPDMVPAGEGHAFAGGKGLKLYKAYQDRLKILNACDFGDLLLHMITIFRTQPDVLAKYQERYRYLLVDEYQDTNYAQYLWLKMLAAAHRNICCVGDDDQSIYSWRGAEIENILKFEKDYPEAKVIRLEQNYRSTGHILATASGLIAANQGRLGKTLWTQGEPGDKVSVRNVWDGRDEARFVGDEVEALQRRKISLNDMAVLVRAGSQTRAFEERFITLGIPYRVVGGPRFYERREVRDAIAYLRVIAQAHDDPAFERILNVPKRGLGEATLQTLHRMARDHQVSLTTAAQNLGETDELRAQARRGLKALLEDFARWREAAARLPHPELAQVVLEESGIIAMWQADKAPDAPGRLENLKELIRAMGEFENLAGFLEHISLVMANEQTDAVEKFSIMTLHSAKGLEFDTVFLAGWEEGVFPNPLALDDMGLAGLEEERRLAYVGLTRAKRKAHVLYASERQIYGQWQSSLPSRFLEELPKDTTEFVSDIRVYAPPRRDGSESFEVSSVPGKRGRHRLIEGTARRLAPKEPETSDFAVGERVFHDKFGYGLIEDVDGRKLSVTFEQSGLKKIMDSFVRRA